MSTAGALVLVGCSLLSAGTATAAVIPGDPLRIYMDDRGRLQARFQGLAEGELQPGNLDVAAGSGTHVTIYPPAEGAVGACDVTPVSGPIVTGSGSSASPYEMSTSYTCAFYGDRLDITKRFIYVNGDAGFLERYTVTNSDDAAIKFRMDARALFSAARTRAGQGWYDPSAPRVVGMLNDAQGVAGGFEEIASTPWSGYLEGPDACGCTNPSDDPEDWFSPGLPNTIDPTLVHDPRVAVQFNRYRSFGIAPGATDTFELRWFFDRYDGLALAPTSGSSQVGSRRDVSATVLNHGQPVPNGVVRYTITGANPSSGNVTTTSDGTSTISWTGTNVGQDTLNAYIDSDNDGAFDPSIDTSQTATFSWTGAASPAAAPPPPAPPPPAPTQPPPARASQRSRQFSIAAHKVAGDGTIVLTLAATSRGSYRATAQSRNRSQRRFVYGSARRAISHAGRLRVAIRPNAIAKRALRHGKLAINVTVRFTPTGAKAQTRRITVVARRTRAPRR